MQNAEELYNTGELDELKSYCYDFTYASVNNGRDLDQIPAPSFKETKYKRNGDKMNKYRQMS